MYCVLYTIDGLPQWGAGFGSHRGTLVFTSTSDGCRLKSMAPEVLYNDHVFFLFQIYAARTVRSINTNLISLSNTL